LWTALVGVIEWEDAKERGTRHWEPWEFQTAAATPNRLWLFD